MPHYCTGGHDRFTCILASIISEDPNTIEPAIGCEDSRFGVTLHYRPLKDDVVIIGTCPDCGLGDLESVSVGDAQSFVAVTNRFQPKPSHRERCHMRQRFQKAQQKGRQKTQQKVERAKRASTSAQGSLF